MRIKMLTRIAGPDFNGAPGDVMDLPEVIAKVLVERGFAEEVTPPPAPHHKSGEGSEIETTDMPAGERAVKLAGAVGKSGKRKPPQPKP